ncbi:excalibur calcium-binding domain-containing protein [Mycobacterium mantenii]|uniref:excalibur calcium-binding domain-containing protein n=1 Tax=Mycobacterium mantenii TaxID=560555 RepID=UPI0009F654B5|nr:excalibur calcium-binding domain-containing protein [Mycobacterium mantenii]
MLRGLLIAAAITVGIAGTPAAVAAPPTTTTSPSPTSGGSAYYPNCRAACAAGVAPIYRGQPGYRSGLDRDNDGIACEVCH